MGLGQMAADGGRAILLIFLGIVIVATSFAAGVHSQGPRLQAWRAYDSKRFSQKQFEERLAARYEQIETKLMWLDAYTRLRSPLFSEDDRGLTAPRVAKFAQTARDFTFARNMSKAYFVYDVIQRTRRHGKKLYSTCSLGFHSGHSAVLLMESAPEATLYEIEPLDVPNFKKNTVYIDNRALLEHLYRERFSYRAKDEHVKRVKEDSAYSSIAVAQLREAKGHDVCDIVLIDAANEVSSKEADLRSFASVANEGTILFGDEAGSYECMTAQYPLEHPVCANTPTSGAAYWKLAREGLIMPLACSSAMSPESIEDRVCAWKYTSKAVKVEPYVGTLNDVMARVEPTMQKVAVRD